MVQWPGVQVSQVRTHGALKLAKASYPSLILSGCRLRFTGVDCTVKEVLTDETHALLDGVRDKAAVLRMVAEIPSTLPRGIKQ